MQHDLSSSWHSPVPLELVPTTRSESFRDQPAGTTGLPLPPHPGAFGVQRKHHVHEGVDLYCEPGTAVLAVEAGTVVSVLAFTGPSAGLPWWLDTEAVMVEGASGVVLYGELEAEVRVGDRVARGQRLGRVTRVLRNDKGRPTSMLHLELHDAGTRAAPEWRHANEPPSTLRDPTQHLLGCVGEPRSPA